MPTYSPRGMRVLFVHIPKTGGSSIEAYLRESSCNADPPRSKHSVLDVHATWDVYQNWGHFDYTFTVIRDPLERFRSELLHLTGDANHVKKIINFFGYKKFEHVKNRWNIKDDHLLEFLRITNDQPRWIGNHVRPQCDFIKPNSNIETFLFPHSIKDVPKVLSTKFGIPVGRMPHRKPSKAMDKPSFSETQAKIIRQFYQQDYERFFVQTN